MPVSRQSLHDRALADIVSPARFLSASVLAMAWKVAELLKRYRGSALKVCRPHRDVSARRGCHLRGFGLGQLDGTPTVSGSATRNTISRTSITSTSGVTLFMHHASRLAPQDCAVYSTFSSDDARRCLNPIIQLARNNRENSSANSPVDAIGLHRPSTGCKRCR